MIKKYIKQRKGYKIAVKNIAKDNMKLINVLVIIQFLFIVCAIIEPYLFGVFIDDILLERKMDLLLIVCSSYFGLYVYNTILTMAQKSLEIRTFNNIKADLKNKIWNKYMMISYSTIVKKSIGDLAERMDKDVNAYVMYIKEGIIKKTYSFVICAIYIIIMFIISWKLCWFSLLMVPISFKITKLLSKGSSEA